VHCYHCSWGAADDPVPVTIYQLAEILAISPGLRTLIFKANISIVSSEQTQLEPIQLNHPETLNLGYPPPESSRVFLPTMAPGSRPMAMSIALSSEENMSRKSNHS
jgi:hypothetical protein